MLGVELYCTDICDTLPLSAIISVFRNQLLTCSTFPNFHKRHTLSQTVIFFFFPLCLVHLFCVCLLLLVVLLVLVPSEDDGRDGVLQLGEGVEGKPEGRADFQTNKDGHLE